jgi:fluoride ion exporter CrcB/FEX
MDYVYLQGNVGDNSTVSYFMLDGLNLGQNLLWTLAAQISVTSFLQLVVQYQGRAVQSHPVIHTGSVTLNAVF